VFIAGFPAGSFQANCYLLGAAGSGEAVVVDPGEGATERILALLAEHRLRAVAVLLTHGHLDHIAAAAEVCRKADIPAYLHTEDHHLLDDPLAGLSPQLAGALSALDLTDLRPPSVLDLSSTPSVELAGLTISVDPTPGHTGGSVVFRVAGAADRPEVLLSGDTLFAGSVGRTDLPGGSTPQLLESIARELLSRPDDAVVLPGHGPTTTIGAERTGNPFLVGLAHA
jgi:hydroxyacylglutathione hydrolase